MSGFTLTLDETPDPELRKAILAPLRKYNANWIGEPVVQPLAIFIRDPQTDEIVGGLWGQSAAGWLFVDLLFVPENLRRRGLGTTLLRDAENVAIKRGDTGVWLSTGNFQAPGFYEHMGYTRFGTHDDYPRGHQTGYYAKRLKI
jgi:GNAT superfamily N-acetyltransferase